ncbi:MAG: hypothetical protein FJ279_04200 [Planctomycetes bacterium]|nr:hypothetical protein [Planctomycetota bacterium]MBM4078971.1 hypothetical protein [Planctomycetota bacterium]
MVETAKTTSVAPRWDVCSDTWVATDALGRVLPTHEDVGPPRPGRVVGIFYFLWLGAHGRQIHDITRILAANPDNPPWGPRHAFHFWGEPLFGYYLSNDEFVIRKHAQMLGDAGVDVLFLDVTNAFIYEDTCLALCRVLEQVRQSGQPTPQIAFLTHSRGAEVVQKLYDRFYAKGLHSELWFRWKGKPLILAAEEGLSATAKEFFTLRESWAWSNPKGWFKDGKDKWPWLDHYPQQPGWHESPDKPEQISVCVAQHPTTNIGRSFHDGKQPPPGQTAPEQGLCFAEQCRRALEVDPELIFITGWNEWTAMRFIKAEKGGAGAFLGKPLKPGDTHFIDQFNQEFSRDIEPMRGGHGDNYYYQMVSFIRRFKGVRPLPAVTPRSITVDGKFDDWRDAQPEYRDTLGDPACRDHPGWGSERYVNATGRNDVVAAKVSFDGRNAYFYVRTREPLTPCADPAWMLLFIDSDHNPATGWLGYDFLVRPQTRTLERHIGGGYRWGSPVQVEHRSAGNEMELAIPRSALGITRSPALLDFKWADGIRETGDAADFTLHGDAAPNDRFNYRAKLTSR